MASARREGAAASRALGAGAVIAGVAAVLVLFPVAFTTAFAAAASATGSLSEADETCLSCHALEGMEKTLANGQTLSLHVGGEAFAESIHLWMGCAGCHEDVDLGTHPVERTFDSARAYRAAASQVCSQCHSDESLKAGPGHHARVSSAGGPACAECHDAHAVGKMAEWKAGVEDTAYCLACHGQALSAPLEDGELHSLSLDEAALHNSVHLDHACADCHAGFSKESHEARALASPRERSIVRAEVCRQCHGDKYEQYAESIHAKLLDDGNLAAPVCTDCHGAHSVGPKTTYETIAGVPCRKCHENIFEAYLGSMHGQARSKPGHIAAPICADCHRAHEVGVASTGTRLRDACLACHEGAGDSHQAWLPNTALHLEAVSCTACHSPKAQRRIDLGLYDAVARTPVSVQVGDRPFDDRVREADADGDGLDAMELWTLVRDMNREGTAAELALRGRMEVHTGVEAHQLAAKSEAVRDCDTCHRDSADPFQTVTISIVRPDGRPAHYEADKEVLSSPVSVGSVSGFYAVGGTRIKLLDILFLLAVLGGVAVPVGHITMRRLLRKDR